MVRSINLNSNFLHLEEEMVRKLRWGDEGNGDDEEDEAYGL